MLWVNRAALPQVRGRVWPIAIGLLPGVAVGTTIVSVVNPSWMKFVTFVALLPLILVQAAGYRRPIRSERPAGFLFGGGVGVLYAATTISGPPLAVALNNQGFSTTEFRAALGFVRLTESTLTAAAYFAAGLFARDSLVLLPQILPGVAVGVPIGAFIIHRLDAETFRRICMSFDAWVVAFGIATLLRDLHVVASPAAYLVTVAVIAIDAWLLFRFFSKPHETVARRL